MPRASSRCVLRCTSDDQRRRHRAPTLIPPSAGPLGLEDEVARPLLPKGHRGDVGGPPRALHRLVELVRSAVVLHTPVRVLDEVPTNRRHSTVTVL
eukprot:3742041-Pyramimonas_sp.AAC.2